jgi:hypothetical protein
MTCLMSPSSLINSAESRGKKTMCNEKKEPVMSRLSIEVTPEQHQRLKAIAALSGMTIKE